MKKISILGSTGSIGTQSLEVADIQGDIEIVALCAYSNIDLMEQQIRKYKPKMASLMNDLAASELKVRVADTNTKIVGGIEGFILAATLPEVDMVLSAVVGVCGLIPTIEAIKAGKEIALANKETLVAGGSIVMPLAKEHNTKIIPVDSEHSAIFQSSIGSICKIKKVLLTASGGPFFGRSSAETYNIPREQALAHPNWSMGAKISIDSATMMNKGLEVIEASWLFDIPVMNIEVLIHRQSIIHSMVEFYDNSVIAQLSVPDMKLPISYAFTYPERKYCGTKSINFFELKNLTFEKPDNINFPCLDLAYKAVEIGGTAPAVLNAANELAVDLYLNRKISFGEIPVIINKTIDNHVVINNPTLDNILDSDVWAREYVKNILI